MERLGRERPVADVRDRLEFESVRKDHPMPLLALLLATVSLAADETSPNTPPAGFIALFNGKDLASWKDEKDAKTHWTVQNGVLHYDGKGDSLRTQKHYGD